MNLDKILAFAKQHKSASFFTVVIVLMVLGTWLGL